MAVESAAVESAAVESAAVKASMESAVMEPMAVEPVMESVAKAKTETDCTHETVAGVVIRGISVIGAAIHGIWRIVRAVVLTVKPVIVGRIAIGVGCLGLRR